MNAPPRILRMLLAVGTIGVVASAILVAPVAGVAATKAPSVTVSPRSDISDPWNDGQYVTVTWRNFTPSAPVGVKECVHGATSLAQCSRGNLYSSCGYLCPGDWLLGISDKNGNGSGTVPIATGKINVDQDLSTDIPGYTFRCGPSDPCDLWVSNDTFNLATGIFVPIGFQPPPDSCVGGGGPSLSASGTASGLRQFRSLAIRVCKPPANVDLGYVLKVSRDAMDDYVAGLAPFAVTSVPMDAVQTQALDGAGRTAAYAPVLASSEVFAFRIYDAVTQNQVTRLTLTPELLARIFSGQLKYWNIPKIKALNPKVAFPQTIAAIGRGDASEETIETTSWIWKAARDAWHDGGHGVPPSQNPYNGPTDILPALASSPNPVALVTGPQAVANTVRTGGTDFTSITQYGTIGYMDSSIAAQYGLPTVRIRYPNGKIVAATPHTIQQAIAAAHTDARGVLHPDYSVQTQSQWPMPVVSYMVIPHGAKKSDSPPEQAIGDAVADLVRTAVGPGQTGLVRGYAPLPPALVKRAHTLADQVWVAPPEPTGGNNGGHQPGNVPGTNGGNTGASGGPVGVPSTPPVTGSTGGVKTPPSDPTLAPPVLPYLPPPSTLLATSWSRALPLVAIVGLACLLLGAVLLFGGPLGARLARSTARVRAVSPLHRRAKLRAVGGSDKDEAAA